MSFAVVDERGDPHAGTVGLSVCPATDEWSCGSDNIWLVDSDGDGLVAVTLRQDVTYDVQAFAVDTGWPQPWVGSDGTEYHFSAETRGLADDFVDGTPLVIAVPVAVEIRVVDGAGEPLPAGVGGVMACEADSSGQCTVPVIEYKVADDIDGDGTVLLGLSEEVRYSATAIARGSGWCNPTMTDDDGLTWHFGEVLLGSVIELAGTELRVVDPCASPP